MRIVEVIGILNIGGAENQVVQLVNGWDGVRIEKHVVVLQLTENHLTRAIGPDVIQHHVPLARRGQLSCIYRLSRLFRRLRPDVVQAHMFHTNLYTVLAARLAGVPVIVTTEHGKGRWGQPVYRWLERHVIAPLSTLRVAVSEDLRALRTAPGGEPAEKMVVIPPCVAIPEQGVEYESRQPCTIGVVGRMVAIKDYPTMLRAFSRVIRVGTDAELVFLGDGPQRSLLENMARELDLEHRVHFLGFQSNVQERVRSFDLVAFSSLSEGIPVAMLEAMAAGVPVVATRVGGIPEAIRDGVDGLLVPSGNAQALADAILRYVGDAALRRQIGSSGRQRVASLYSREAICSRYETIFRELLSERTRHA
ncbi:MAG: glycosyltransferase [Desulfobulbus sp.]|jgi:glycosyltransferase involved in cell wall biosynthesis